MLSYYRQFEQLQSLIETQVQVAHIASSPLYHVDPALCGAEARAKLERRHYLAAPIRPEGSEGPTRFVRTAELVAGPAGEQAHRIEIEQIVTPEAPVIDLIGELVERQFLFVLEDRRVHGIVTRSDLQRVPVRLLTFGLVTLLEIKLRAVMRADGMDAELANYLKPDRVERAETFQRRRRERDEELDLLTCLQFSDLKAALAKTNLPVTALGLPSKQRFRDEMERLTRLRDGLAHANPLPVEELTERISTLRSMIGSADLWLSSRAVLVSQDIPVLPS